MIDMLKRYFESDDTGPEMFNWFKPEIFKLG